MIQAHALEEGITAFPLTVVMIGLVAAHLGLVAVLQRRSPVTSMDEGIPPGHPPLGQHRVGRTVGLCAYAVLVVLAVFGSSTPSRNFADVAVLSLLWGCLAVASVAVGPLWHRIDPLWGMTTLLRGAPPSGAAGERVGGAAGRPAEGDGGARGGTAGGAPGDRLPLPGVAVRVGLAASLLGWAWAQLLWRPGREAFLVALLGYSVAHIIIASRRGRSWLRGAEALNAMSATLGLLRPRGAVRSLVAARASVRPRVVAAVLIGWGLMDLVVESTRWTGLQLTTTVTPWVGPLVLIALCAAVGGVLHTVLGRRFGILAVPLAGGWVVAQYLPRIVLQSQGLVLWLSDPFGTGADLLRTGGRLVDPLLVAPLAMVTVQMAAFLAGHVLAAVAAGPLAAAGGVRGSVSAATLAPRALVVASLAGGAYLQLAGL